MPMEKLTKGTELLSENDWKRIAYSLRHLERTELEVSLGDLKVRVTTVDAAPVFNVAMLVRVEQWKPRVYTSQYFESIEAARR